jgi:hypothetical protein
MSIFFLRHDHSAIDSAERTILWIPKLAFSDSTLRTILLDVRQTLKDAFDNHFKSATPASLGANNLSRVIANRALKG